jgi:hypothetical protein
MPFRRGKVRVNKPLGRFSQSVEVEGTLGDRSGQATQRGDLGSDST